LKTLDDTPPGFTDASWHFEKSRLLRSSVYFKEIMYADYRFTSLTDDDTVAAASPTAASTQLTERRALFCENHHMRTVFKNRTRNSENTSCCGRRLG
jgi:hypothetical protein